MMKSRRDLKKNIMRKIKLESKKIDNKKLLEYGFTKKEDIYEYKKDILDDKFTVEIKIKNNKLISKLIEKEYNDEYLMIDIKDISGEFVGKVKEEYERVINDIIEKCTDIDIFKSKEAKLIIKYIKEKYDNELEYLWKKFPENAIARNKENKKWYLVILTLDESKLIEGKSGKIEILDIRYQKDSIESIIDNVKFFPGYHMNKKSWITIKLDNSIKIEEIYKLIDNSYNLTK